MAWLRFACAVLIAAAVPRGAGSPSLRRVCTSFFSVEMSCLTVDSTFRGNTSGYGAAINLSENLPETLSGDVFEGNSATGNGGAIYNDGAGGSGVNPEGHCSGTGDGAALQRLGHHRHRHPGQCLLIRRLISRLYS